MTAWRVRSRVLWGRSPHLEPSVLRSVAACLVVEVSCQYCSCSLLHDTGVACWHIRFAQITCETLASVLGGVYTCTRRHPRGWE